MHDERRTRWGGAGRRRGATVRVWRSGAGPRWADVASRKTAAVLQLLRGEDLETVSRGLGVTAATLSGWRDAFLAAGEASLTTRQKDGEELASERLKAKLGDMLLKTELLEAKIAVLEDGRPLVRRRSRP